MEILKNVLIVDNKECFRVSMKKLLKKAGFGVETVC